MQSTSFGGIGGQPGLTSNPRQTEHVDVQPDGGHAGNNPGKGAMADNTAENTAGTTEGVGVVVPVTEPVTAAGNANGAPSNIQTVEAKLGKETHNVRAVLDETPGEVGS